MVNTKLLNDTVRVIQAQPEKYYQGTWISNQETCGTTMCFAGHAAVLAGAETPDPSKHEIADWYVEKGTNKYLNWRQAGHSGPYESVRQYATNALGITDAEASYLFDGDRSWDSILTAVEELNETGQVELPDVEDYEDYCCESCSGY